MKRLGVMGGTFDPIHYGHLMAAEEACARFDLERVIFVPNGQPPHKKDYAVSHAEHRYAMTLLATCSNLRFEASRLELERPGPSYAVDTMTAMRERFGPEAALYFITGADAVQEILTWKDPRRLLAICEFIAAARPGYRLDEALSSLDADLRRRVHALDIPGVDVSSTQMRARAAAGLPLTYLAPPQVVTYIAKHNLYASPGGAPPSSINARGKEVRTCL
jgi:nicotinate-nucleotide adenylyltransferase